MVNGLWDRAQARDNAFKCTWGSAWRVLCETKVCDWILIIALGNLKRLVFNRFFDSWKSSFTFVENDVLSLWIDTAHCIRRRKAIDNILDLSPFSTLLSPQLPFSLLPHLYLDVLSLLSLIAPRRSCNALYSSNTIRPFTRASHCL